MSLTPAEVVKALIEITGNTYEDGVWGSLFYNRRFPSRLDGYIYDIATTFGGEGQGDVAYAVVSVSPVDGTSTQYFRKDGFYSSYDGFTWDGDFYEVHQTARIVTFYEDKVASTAFDMYDYDSFDEEDSSW